MMTDLTVLKEKLIDILSLRDIRPADIDDDAPLFNKGLGLDSADVVLLSVGMEDQYGVKIESVQETRRAFASIRSLAAFIDEKAAPD
jgi:acyl carrier protein